MDRFFLERIVHDEYNVAIFDKHRIFSAKDPGQLATVFTCSLSNPSIYDDAQIFYAMAPSIGATDFFIDLINRYRSHRLNTWSIVIKDYDVDNLFNAVQPLDRTKRLELYGTQRNITPASTVVATSDSLFSIVSLSEQQIWKTGILQRCIDRLVKKEYRKQPHVYSVIDEEYRRIMRFMIEVAGIFHHPNRTDDAAIFHSGVINIIKLLGLKNSHDTAIFSTISPKLHIIICLINKSIIPLDDDQVVSELSKILTKWSGSSVKKVHHGYQLVVEPNVLEGVSYMQPLLESPDSLVILDAPM